MTVKSDKNHQNEYP